MSFDKTEHNFGKVKKGDVLVHTFYFQNTGTDSFKIELATGSCGCTVPDYPETLIKPGDKGKIMVTFDTAEKEIGDQHSEVTILLDKKDDNDYPIVYDLKIKAMVTE